MKTITDFDPETSRYAFDFRLCHFKNGWAQLDTRQDASYYGNWINPVTRQLEVAPVVRTVFPLR